MKGFENAWGSAGGIFLIAFLSTLQVKLCQGESLVLDVNSDATKVWIKIDCVYSEDYNEFWIYGCPENLSGDEDVYPSQKGFWKPCHQKSCEIQYFGGLAPFAQKVTFGLYSKGASKISVSSKYSFLEEEFKELGNISVMNVNGWGEASIDLSKQIRARVLNFTLENVEGVFMLDKIIIDLGPNVTFPTEPPPTTTGSPIKNEIITLNKEQDYWILWNVNCTYVEDVYDFLSFGCPSPFSSSLEDSTGIGFWNPCQANKCSLNFLGSGVIPSYSPKLIKLDYLLEGTGEIRILGVTDRGEDKLENFTASGTSWTTGWISLDSKDYKDINVELIPGSDGIAIVDKIELNLDASATTPTTTPPTTTSTTIASTTTTSSTTTEAPVEAIVLDTEKDNSVIWEEDCVYVDDIVYFDAFGCPVTSITPPQGSTGLGYWSPCKSQTCEILYSVNDTVVNKPPTAMTLDYYLEGSGKLKIYIPIELGGRREFQAWKTFEAEGGWKSTTLDLDEEHHTDMRIELVPGEHGVAVVDRVRLSLKPKSTPTPTSGPSSIPTRTSTTFTPSSASSTITPTTEAPLEKIVLDTEKDNSVIWEEDCVYVDDIKDFEAFGCPVNGNSPPPGSSRLGFWSPCKSQTCDILYSVNETVVRKPPTAMTLDYYLQGSGKLMVYVPIELGGNRIVLEAEGGGWNSAIVILNEEHHNDMRIELVPGANGIAVVDKITLTLTSATTTTTTPAGSSSNPSSETPTPPSGSNELIKLNPMGLLFMQIFVFLGIYGYK